MLRLMLLTWIRVIMLYKIFVEMLNQADKPVNIQHHSFLTHVIKEWERKEPNLLEARLNEATKDYYDDIIADHKERHVKKMRHVALNLALATEYDIENNTMVDFSQVMMQQVDDVGHAEDGPRSSEREKQAQVVRNTNYAICQKHPLYHNEAAWLPWFLTPPKGTSIRQATANACLGNNFIKIAERFEMTPGKAARCVYQGAPLIGLLQTDLHLLGNTELVKVVDNALGRTKSASKCL